MNVSMISSWTSRCGIANYCKDLVDEMLKLGLEVSVLDEDVWKGKPFLRNIVDGVSDDDPDVIHLQYEYQLYGTGLRSIIPLMIPWLEIAGWTTVVTMHLVFPKNSSDTPLAKRLGRSLATRQLKISSAVVVHQEEAKEIFERDYGFNNVHVIPHGTKIRDLGKEGNLILYFGFTVPGKGIEYLIRAMAEVKEDFPDVQLKVIGSPHPHAPEAEKYYGKLKEMSGNLHLNISFPGYLPDDELDEEISRSILCVFPYSGEAEGIHSCSLLNRAAGFGKACVCTYGIREAKGRALVGPPRDGRSLARAIKDLLSDESLRRKLGRRLRSWATSWKDSARMHKELYEEMMP